MVATIPDVKNDRRIRVLPFDEGRPIWTEMLTKCTTATLYHQDSWLELLNRTYGFALHLATLEENACVVAACILARTKVPLRRRFVSLPFSDYCPPLALNDHAALGLMEALAHRSFPGAAIEVRGAGAAPGWHRAERFVNWTLHFEPGLAEVERQFSMNFRRNLRRAARENIVVSRSSAEDYLRRFYRMHLLTRRRFGLPAQPWRFFILLREIFAPSNDLEIWLASRGGKDVAGAVIIRAARAVYYKWGARQPGDDSRANHLLMWNAIEYYCSRTDMIDLGRTDVGNSGLMRFKKELGASATSIPYFYHPHAPKQVSAEALGGARKSVAAIWKNLPIFATRFLGRAIYRYLA